MADEIPETPVEETIQTPPAPVPQVQTEARPAAAPPPAASLVIDGEKSERELQLERDLETERDRAKKAEIIAAEWQDKATTLKEIPAPPKPPKVKRGRSVADIILGNDDDNDE